MAEKSQQNSPADQQRKIEESGCVKPHEIILPQRPKQAHGGIQKPNAQPCAQRQRARRQPNALAQQQAGRLPAGHSNAAHYPNVTFPLLDGKLRRIVNPDHNDHGKQQNQQKGRRVRLFLILNLDWILHLKISV